MAKSQVALMEGEKVEMILEAELYATSTNFIANVLGKIFGIIAKLLGVKSIGFMTVTNKRVIIEKQDFVLWCFNRSGSCSTLMPQSIATVDVANTATFLFCMCKKYVLTISTAAGSGYAFVVKGGAQQASEAANAVLKAFLIGR